MRYWWLNYGDDMDGQIDGGYVALPLRDSVGASKSSWTRLKEVRAGDLLIGCDEQTFVSIVAVLSEAERETLDTGGAKSFPALIIDARHVELAKWIDLEHLAQRLGEHLEPGPRPWEREPGRFGELHALPDAAGMFMLEAADALDGHTGHGVAGDAVVEALYAGELDEDTARALDEARAGQGSFRDNVMSLAGNRCCLSGLATPELLSVHHIKFWLSSTNDERLDPHNGLVLAPTYGVAFMSGLLSFDDEGQALISELMEPTDVARLGLRAVPGVVLRSERQRAYLAWHRAQIWRP
jgi:putative restriction endonuclease